MFSPLRILYHFWIWPIPSYLKEPPCTLRTHSVETIQHYTLWRNKNKYECLVGYNFRSTQGRPTNLHPNEGLRSPHFEYHIIFEGLGSSLFEYHIRSTQGRPTNLHPNEGLGSSLFEYHSICEFAQFLHTLKSLRVHRALLKVAGVLSGNKSTLPCEEIKIDMNVWFDITSEVYQWEQIKEIQINMNVWFEITSEVFKEADKFISKWKPMFSPWRILYHFWIWPISSYLKEPPCTQSIP